MGNLGRVDFITGVVKPDEKGRYQQCPNSVGINKEKRSGRQFLVPCKSWKCPHCGPKRKHGILDDVRDGYNNFKYDEDVVRLIAAGWCWTFLTLTLKVGSDSDIKEAWNRFRSRLRRLGVCTFCFVWGLERGEKNGMVHLHVIMLLPFIYQSVLSNIWRDCTGDSYIVYITRLHGLKNAAGYMFKYVFKDVDDDAYGRYEHRFGFSRNWARPNLFLRRLRAMRNKGKYVFTYLQRTRLVTNGYNSVAILRDVISRSPLRDYITIVKERAFDEPEVYTGNAKPLWQRYQMGDFSYLDKLNGVLAVTKQQTLKGVQAVMGRIKYKKVKTRCKKA